MVGKGEPRLFESYGSISNSPALLSAPPRSVMGHIGDGYGAQAQQAYHDTAIFQETTLGLAPFRTLKGVLLPPFDPTPVGLEHVHEQA